MQKQGLCNAQCAAIGILALLTEVVDHLSSTQLQMAVAACILTFKLYYDMIIYIMQ